MRSSHVLVSYIGFVILPPIHLLFIICSVWLVIRVLRTFYRTLRTILLSLEGGGG